MRTIALLLCLLLLLCGCAPAAPAPTDSTVPPTTAVLTQPQPTASETTQPPDPMQMLMDAMSTEEKVGQLFLARYPGEAALSDALTYCLGGYILFGKDFENRTPDSLKQELVTLQFSVPIPLFLAVDEEGGTVTRVSRYSAFRSTPFPSPRQLYASGGMEAVLKAEEEKAQLLRSLALNINMAPVCDISTTPGAFMYQRSLGQSPEITGQFVSQTVDLMQQHRIGSVLKHFPGYGDNADTHTGMARDDRNLEDLEHGDLLPFSAGIQAGCGAVLMSHTVVSALDPELPVSLSPAAHRYLRETMGFDGVILTDDLAMEAITDTYGSGEAAVLAVLAGNDLLCSTDYATQYAAVLDAVQNGRISAELLDSAVLRVLQWKRELGLIF